MKVVYSTEQKKAAIKTYKRLKSVTKTIRVLGYPSRHTLHDWIHDFDHKNPNANKGGRPTHYTYEFKYEVVQRALNGENPKDIGESLNMRTYTIIYDWLRVFRMRGATGLMSKREKIEAGIYKTKSQLKKELPDDTNELKELAARLLAEKAVLEQELELVKKCPGGIPNKLSPKTKALIARNLRARFPLELLFEVLKLNRSSYYYANYAAKKPDKYEHLRHAIREISALSKYTYGSPRIWCCLRRRGIFVSEKVVRRLMKEEAIQVYYASRKRKYSSYIGEITPAVHDKVCRNFHAEKPNKLWLTDISEFAAQDKKVYLSPLIDCFDGKVIAWETSNHPDIQLVENMLKKAFLKLNQTDSKESDLIIHTDRGGHYRGGRWIEALEGQGIKRSMSRKGNSGDNAACEGFFGRMKTEMYYGRKWEKAAELEKAIHEYIAFYNNDRIKMSLGGISIKEHRAKLSEMSKKAS